MRILRTHCVVPTPTFQLLSVLTLPFCNALMANDMHSSYNQYLFHSFLSALHVSNESSRPLSGAQHNILYYTVWYNRAGTIIPIVLCNTVYYAVLLMMDD